MEETKAVAEEMKTDVASTRMVPIIAKKVEALDRALQKFMAPYLRWKEASDEIDGLQAQIEALTEEVAALRRA
jgi:hypothetical protein